AHDFLDVDLVIGPELEQLGRDRGERRQRVEFAQHQLRPARDQLLRTGAARIRARVQRQRPRRGCWMLLAHPIGCPSDRRPLLELPTSETLKADRSRNGSSGYLIGQVGRALNFVFVFRERAATDLSERSEIRDSPYTPESCSMRPMRWPMSNGLRTNS